MASPTLPCYLQADLSHRFLPLKIKSDAAHDYLEDWITVFGCSRLAQNLLGPCGRAMRAVILSVWDKTRSH